jgi:hypothetical protein
MIYEYAEQAFGGPKEIRQALELSTSSQERLTNSANNLSPLLGGRHANTRAGPSMKLTEQREYIANLLRRWFAQYAQSAGAAIVAT